MRCHLKRTLQVTTAVIIVFVYMTFMFTNRTSLRLQPSAPQQISVYPSKENYKVDRIVEQLQFIPQAVQNVADKESIKLKKIYVKSGLEGWNIKGGRELFLEQKCLVNQCYLLDEDHNNEADVVLYQSTAMNYDVRKPGQIWALFILESPYHSEFLGSVGDKVNWTATYRHDSTIVAPYEKFVPFNSSILTKKQEKNYAAGKTKKIAWFVSNCGTANKRGEYAAELSKYMQVDIYGSCGTFACPRHDPKCSDILNTDYKFYLSFENSNCRDYITEKFFVNGLQHDVIPIVMGAAMEDYERAAPLHSFIHVDQFKSPKHLADYLIKLDNDDKLYNEYFQWKGTGSLINTYFWCRMCALAHDQERGPSWYQNIGEWWQGDNICIGDKSWKDFLPKQTKFIADFPIVELTRKKLTN